MENTNNQQTSQTIVTKKTVKKVKRVLANKSIFFSIFIVIFALVGFFLFCMDESNFIRQKMPALDAVTRFFQGMGIHFNVSMLTWLIFFIFVVVFFAIFTTLFFRKTNTTIRIINSFRIARFFTEQQSNKRA